MLSFFSVILVVICLDQVSKFWVMHHFVLHESRVVIPHFFNLTYITNNGAAFSMLAGQPALWRQVFFLCTASVGSGFNRNSPSQLRPSQPLLHHGSFPDRGRGHRQYELIASVLVL